MSKHVLLFKDNEGNLVGVICNSRKRAEMLREVAENSTAQQLTYGIIRVVSFSEALLGPEDSE